MAKFLTKYMPDPDLLGTDGQVSWMLANGFDVLLFVRDESIVCFATKSDQEFECERRMEKINGRLQSSPSSVIAAMVRKIKEDDL